MKQTFIILGIVLLGIAIAVVYFERKLREQNHKIASMFSLVSSLAEELNSIKYNTSVCSREPETIHIGNQLIDVSDDEMELIEDDVSESIEMAEDDDDDDDEEVESEMSETDSSSLEELDLQEYSKKEEEKKSIKVLKLDLESEEETETEKEKKTDFKKMNVAELRTIALQKGMDAAKLKKNELIELLSK